MAAWSTLRKAALSALILVLAQATYICAVGAVAAVNNATSSSSYITAEASPDPLQPVTVTTRMRLDADAANRLSGIWLAGLGAIDHAAPSTLALSWTQVSSGWFGDRWGLQLASSAGIIPNTYAPQDGSGFLSGTRFLNLTDAEPAWGHEYETIMSYFPACGALSVQLTDLTTAQQVYAGNLQVMPFTGPLYPGTGYALVDNAAPGAPPPVYVQALTTQSAFRPLQVGWGLVQPGVSGLLFTSVINRQSDTALRLMIPWRNLPGKWRLSIVNGSQKRVLAQYETGEPDALYHIPADIVQSLPAGKVMLALDYQHQDDVTFTNQEQISIGNVQAKILNLQTQPNNSVSGVLHLTADGAVGGVAVQLKATVSRKFYDRDNRGIAKYTNQYLQSKVPISQQFTALPTALDIPFELNLADLATDQYTDGQLLLEPQLTPLVDGVACNGAPENISVTIGKPRFVIQPDVRHQTIAGFGASGAWWSQYLGGMSDAMRNHIADLLFSPDHGIALSQYRYNAGGGIDEDIPDPWRTAETFEVTQGQYDWSRDANARWFLHAAKERGVEDFILFAVSPPRRMTKSGHTYNKTKSDANLPESMFLQFAQYLADIWKHFHDDEGITFSTISPLNEPEWLWEGGNQEGTPFTLEQVMGIATTLNTTLVREGIPAKLLVPESGAWEYLYGKGRSYADAINKDPALAANTILAMHSYWTTDDQRQLAGLTMQRYPNQQVWQTEWCEMMGVRDYGMDSALTLAHTVYADLTLANVSAWQHWVAVDRYDHRDSLLYTEYFKPGDPENIEETKKLWALGNFSRFVRPGAVRIEVQSNYARPTEAYRSAVLMSAFTDKNTGKIIVVAINQSPIEQQVHLSIQIPSQQISLTPYRTSDAESLAELAPVTLSAAQTGGWAEGVVALAPLSVTTYVTQ